MDIFDIFIAYVTWDGVSGGIGKGKKRPVLILEQTTDAVIVFKITTQYEAKSNTVRSKYFMINDWRQAGLNKESYIDTNRTVTLPLSAVDINHPVGTLTEADIQKFIDFLSM